MASPALAPTEIRSKLCKRYQEAYTVAAAIIRVANLVRFVSIGVGALIIIVGFAQGSDAGFGPILIGGALVAGLSLAAGGWISSMVIQAQGQIIHFMIDTAVNTSPLLDNSSKAQFLGTPATDSGLIVRHGAGF